MSEKSISSALRQLIQKEGNLLEGKRPARSKAVSASKELAEMPRGDATRRWGDQERAQNQSKDFLKN